MLTAYQVGFASLHCIRWCHGQDDIAASIDSVVVVAGCHIIVATRCYGRHAVTLRHATYAVTLRHSIRMPATDYTDSAPYAGYYGLLLIAVGCYCSYINTLINTLYATYYARRHISRIFARAKAPATMKATIHATETHYRRVTEYHGNK